jgi:LPXTG-motif cell wall-anchored protein|tara:strand:+ start:241 stop:615 length:375 start_codon:yes stop_codon:yes gene_type:complete
MTQYGPSLDQYLVVIGFLIVLLIGFYFFKKNKHLISSKLQNQKRMKVSEVTILGQGDRALILNLDEKDFLFISGKNSGALLTEIKSNKSNQFNPPERSAPESSELKRTDIKNLIEKRIKDDQKK